MINLRTDDLRSVENMVELLDKHLDSLPNELQESIREVAKIGICDIDASFINQLVIRNGEDWDNLKCSMDLKENPIENINTVLKRVVVKNKKLYPEAFYMKYRDLVIAEW